MSASLRRKLYAAAMAGLAATVGSRTSYAELYVAQDPTNPINPINPNTGTPSAPREWFDSANWTTGGNNPVHDVPGDGVGSDNNLAVFDQALPAGDYYIDIGAALPTLNSMRFYNILDNGTDFTGKTFTYTATPGVSYPAAEIRGIGGGVGPDNVTITMNLPISSAANLALTPGKNSLYRLNGPLSFAGAAGITINGPTDGTLQNPVPLSQTATIDLPNANPGLGALTRINVGSATGAVDLQIGDPAAFAGGISSGVLTSAQSYDFTISLRGTDLVSAPGRKFVAGIQRFRAIADPSPGADNTVDRTMTLSSTIAGGAAFAGLALRGPNGQIEAGFNGAGQTGHFTLKLVSSPNEATLHAVPIDLAPNATLEFNSDSAFLTRVSASDTRTGISSAAAATFISGTGDVVKTGSGVVNIETGNTYSGPTRASGGILRFTTATGSATSSSAIVLNPTGTLELDNTAGNNNDRIGDSATVTSNGGTLSFVGNSSTATSETMGTLAVTDGAGTVQVSSAVAGATVTFAGISRTGGTVNFTLDPNVSIVFATPPTLVNGIIGGWAIANNTDWAVASSPVSAYAAYTTDTLPATWTSTQNINIASSTPAVLVSSTINSLRLDNNLSIAVGQTLTLGTGGLLAPGTANPTIAGPGKITAGASAADLIAYVSSAANTLTIGAPIANNGGGAVTFVKSGAGKVLLTAANTYTGGTKVLQGTLAMGAANTISGDLTISGTGTFDLGGFGQTFNNVILISGSAVNNGAAANLTANTAIAVRSGSISATLAGGATLTKTSTGTVTLGTADSYTGLTTVSAGTLAAGAANAIPNGGNVTVTGGTLDIGAFNQSAATVTLTGGTIAGTSGVLSAGTLFNMQAGTANAILSGAAPLTKSGLGTVVLGNSANSYSGATNINGGTLSVGSSGALGNGSGTNGLNFNGGTLKATGSFDNPRAVTLGSGGGGTVNTNVAVVISFSGVVSGSGNLTKAGVGTLVLSNSGNTYSGATNINGGTLSAGSSSSLGNAGVNNGLTFNGGTLLATGAISSAARNVTVSAGSGNINTNSNAVTVGNVTGVGSFAKSGAGNLTVNLARVGNLAVTGGRMIVAPNGGATGVNVINSLAVGNAQLDIGDNHLIDHTTPVGALVGTTNTYSGMTGAIQSGRNGGNWSGNGVVTSQTAATTSNVTSIGVATAQEVKGLANPSDTAVWAGQTVTGSDTLVMYTYGGDANLDGKINVDDYGHIDTSIPVGIAGWFNGDFNYDGKINVDDYGIIDFNVGIRGAPFFTAGGAALSGVGAVPEPTAMVALTTSAVALGLRRRRRS